MYVINFNAAMIKDSFELLDSEEYNNFMWF